MKNKTDQTTTTQEVGFTEKWFTRIDHSRKEGNYPETLICKGNYEVVAHCPQDKVGKEEAEANAKRIVTAVNAHDSLVAALHEFVDVHEESYVSAMADDSQRTAYDEAMDRAKSLLSSLQNS